MLPAFQSEVNVASDCDISVIGIKENGEETDPLPFSFGPTSPFRLYRMAYADVARKGKKGDFTKLRSVKVTIADAAVAAAGAVLVVDDVHHINRC